MSFERPERHCNGGPNGTAWCGLPATVVCRDPRGLEWYACDAPAHQEGAALTPIAHWFDQLVAHQACDELGAEEMEPLDMDSELDRLLGSIGQRSR